MAGFTGEKRWRHGMNTEDPSGGVSETVKELSLGMVKALNDSETAFAEMQELYTYAGGTIQDLANLLFKEDIEARKSPGTNAQLTVDINTDGGLEAVTIVNAGSGYKDGNYTFTVSVTDGLGSGGSVDYAVSNGSVSSASIRTAGTGYTGAGTSTVINFPLAGLVSDTSANVEEVAKTQAAFDAVTAMHELYLAASNQTVAAEDRLAQLRRMT